MLDLDVSAEEKAKGHYVWPWNASLVFCPVDGMFHRFGCECVRKDPDIIPKSLHQWYRENWEAQGGGR